MLLAPVQEIPRDIAIPCNLAFAQSDVSDKFHPIIAVLHPLDAILSYRTILSSTSIAFPIIVTESDATLVSVFSVMTSSFIAESRTTLATQQIS